MAIFHLNAKAIGRSQGRSATGAAAYRAGARIVDARTGLVFDYTRKRGVDGAEILTPDGTAPDRATLWNAVEQVEKRCDAQVAREVELALPRELTPDQMRAAVRGFAREQFVAIGMVADIAFHHLHGVNPHAHILLTLRDWRGGAFGLKRRDWNDRALCERWRERWAAHANAALAQAGHNARIDHRTLIEQAATALEEKRHEEAATLDRAPTIHESGNSNAAAHNAAVGEANAARLANWQDIEQAAREGGRLMPVAFDDAPGSWPDLAGQDLEHRDALGKSNAPKALRWRFHDSQADKTAAWLARKVGGDARRLSARDAAARDLRLARIAWDAWQAQHPRPFWPWLWPRWRREQSQARACFDATRSAARRADRRASPEAIEAWRRAYAVKESENAAAMAARRALAMLPSEQAQARRDRFDRLHNRDTPAQAKAWAQPKTRAHVSRRQRPRLG
jgi:hypothetical protein